MAEGTSIRPLADNDIDRLCEIDEYGPDVAWNRSSFRDAVLDESTVAIGLFTNGVLIGFVIGVNLGSEFEIYRIAVHPDCQRKGFARRLIGALIDRFQSLRRIILEVAEDNASARSFYRALGFAELGRRERYYVRPDGRIAAVLLSLDVATRT